MTQDRLRFHLSAHNALNIPLAAGARALAVVTGPDAYVSPDWYAAANQVPTWNYVAAEMEGPVRVMSRAEATTLMDDLAAHFEARLAPKPPWTRAKMDPARFEAMLGGIVAYEMRLERVDGTTKLSQNKPSDEIARVAAGLAARDDAGSQAIARLMGA
jgi:transcriptional regulator